MGFEVTDFSGGLAIVLTGFIFAWAFGLCAKIMKIGGED